MKLNNHIHYSTSERRAFTVIELLIVVSIIALLMALSFVVFVGLTDQAKEEATNATIQKVNRLLEQRIEAFDRAFRGSRAQAYITATRGLLTSKKIFGVRDEVVEIAEANGIRAACHGTCGLAAAGRRRFGRSNAEPCPQTRKCPNRSVPPS